MATFDKTLISNIYTLPSYKHKYNGDLNRIVILVYGILVKEQII